MRNYSVCPAQHDEGRKGGFGIIRVVFRKTLKGTPVKEKDVLILICKHLEFTKRQPPFIEILLYPVGVIGLATPLAGRGKEFPPRVGH